MQPAPYHGEITGEPDAQAFWLRAADQSRLRIAVWRGGDRGTVLIFPGRTEYVEKYAHAARELGARGFSSLAIDWRGQGLADRPAHDPRAGHVRDFSEYQADLQAVLDVLPELDLPKPFYLVAHSMGGCIGLRALHNALPVRAAAFSAPMWDIGVKPPMRLLGWGLSHLSRVFGYSHHYAPKTGPVTYVAEAPFADNMLTTDAAMYALMQDQARARPELTLGGPTFAWLAAAFDEIAALRRMPSPPVPAYCALGGRERIVSPEAIHDRMARWPRGTLDVIADAEHEVIMETAAIRARFFDAATALFAANP